MMGFMTAVVMAIEIGGIILFVVCAGVALVASVRHAWRRSQGNRF